MTIRTQAGVVVIVVALACSGMAWAQDPPAAPEPQAPRQQTAAVSLGVEVVIARYRDEKRVSSLPYSLTVTTGPGMSTLRMGSEIPVVTQSGAGPVTTTYRPVGTNIDASAAAIDGGRYRVLVTIDDSSIHGTEPADGLQVPSRPVFRSFRTSNTIILRDGQSTQFTAATDPVSGEVVRVEVTLRVLP